jgi:hypothetical protein
MATTGGAIFSMNHAVEWHWLQPAPTSFNGVDGLVPEGSLTLSGAKLYGMAGAGGSSFKARSSESTPMVPALPFSHNFQGGASDGQFTYWKTSRSPAQPSMGGAYYWLG